MTFDFIVIPCGLLYQFDKLVITIDVNSQSFRLSAYFASDALYWSSASFGILHEKQNHELSSINR